MVQLFNLILCVKQFLENYRIVPNYCFIFIDYIMTFNLVQLYSFWLFQGLLVCFKPAKTKQNSSLQLIFMVLGRPGENLESYDFEGAKESLSSEVHKYWFQKNLSTKFFFIDLRTQFHSKPIPRYCERRYWFTNWHRQIW